MSNIINEDKNEVRRYLLSQLDDADEERLELRLLTDPAFGEEFDTVVDEIADQYAGNEFEGDERKRVEQYFLKSAERQQKVHFARELIERAATERGGGRDAVTSKPGFIERVLAFWRNQTFSFRTAAAMATIVVVVGLGYLASFRDTGPGTLASISLTISSPDRATGTEVKPVKLERDTRAVRIELTLPDPQAQNYRVELKDEKRSRNLTVKERTGKSLIVEIPANDLARGSYVIHLHAMNPDGTEQRVRGHYSFSIV